MQHVKHIKATYEIPYMQHIIAIIETWSAYMTWYLLIMFDDAHDQVLTTF